MAREQEERTSRLRVQAKCKKIMERYPGLRAQPVWIEREERQGQRRGSWHVAVSQAS